MFYRVLRVIARAVFAFIWRVEAIGVRHVPAEGPVILCCNHISVVDPPFIGAPLNREVHFMAKAELFRIPLLRPLIVKLGAFPVKRGGVSKESIRTALRLLAENRVIGIFPAGTRSADIGIGKKGAASLALKSGATVIPVAIIGNYKPFRKMKIVYGPPVDLSEFRDDPSSEGLERATERIMASIKELAERHR